VKFITSSRHSALDFSVGALMMLTPWIYPLHEFGLAAELLPGLAGLFVLAYSLATRYEFGLFGVVTVETNVRLDFLTGFFLALSPWFFEFIVESPRAWLPHLVLGSFLMGLACVAASTSSVEQPSFADIRWPQTLPVTNAGTEMSNVRQGGVTDMCDYSLHAHPNRLAAEGETLVATRFSGGSMGFASPEELRSRSAWDIQEGKLTAVCVPPGARLLLDGIPQQMQQELGVTETEIVTFTQLGYEAFTHRDAVRFDNGREIRLQLLRENQRAIVLSLSNATDREEHQEPVLDFAGNRTYRGSEHV